ncbi:MULTISPECIES: hypothetical protein [unclassified Caballeronia]|uniref:hypothetical protein n=1 Tax=unclassified Caballeronia TaxID=2646786 RepID=UPI00285F285F|nr:MULTISPECIES: hypothetical protein [unclassified Caballeronia]MDR5770657.1 hypothetical protein [Caballeronia sp. LZ002]MDR5846094.1 hypothetical protein [Caballeronia sp. LZ003]
MQVIFLGFGWFRFLYSVGALFSSGKLLWFLAVLCSSRLPGGGVTFFAAAKKVTKESSFGTGF